jgi:glycine/D-amino acid oxidase-like deaminating enzyme/nitrite reductase/ring-hydroxylating ferredoxin subunit
MTSLWLSSRITSTTPPGSTAELIQPDVVVIGAGITGLTTAVLLARAGKKVAVVEAHHIGAGASGNTTGKVTVLQGSKLARIAGKHGRSTLRSYIAGNSEGRDWILRYCQDRGLDVQQVDDYSYAQEEAGVGTARSVLDACEKAGLVEAEWVEEADVPFPFRGGVRLPNQAQINPMLFLDGLTAELNARGASILQSVRAISISGKNPLELTLATIDSNGTDSQHYSLRTPQCILATGIPILDRGGFFARLKAERSYCLAFDLPGDMPNGTYISVDSPTRSVRYAPAAGGHKLIVGGAGHPVGRSKHPADGVSELTEWAERHFPGAVKTHFWSAQDYAPVDELPYVGPLLPGMDSLYVATGFDKWGMTNGVAAALALAAQILGGHTPWASAFTSWSPHELTGVATALQANLEVGFNLAKGWLSPMTAATSTPMEGTGVVSGVPWRLRADCVVNGQRHTVSPVCPHLGGIVRWNEADQAWECPLHGSRFAANGALLEGPATQDLTPLGETRSTPSGDAELTPSGKLP